MKLEQLENKLQVEIDILRERVKDKTELDSEDFNLRGELYNLAFAFGPEARNQDLEYMHKWINPVKGEKSVDIAAGTGFLTKPLSSWTENIVYAVDPSEIQLKNCLKKCGGLPVQIIQGSLSDMQTLEKIGEDVGDIDIVTSFGGIHHIYDGGQNDLQKKMFDNVSKILKSGGRFVAGDVGAGTKLSDWFEKVTKSHCLTGHEEQWLSEERLRNDLIKDNDFDYIKSEIVNIQWVFESKVHMALFMKALNALDLTNDEIIELLDTHLGYEEKEGKVYLNWPMILFHLEKK